MAEGRCQEDLSAIQNILEQRSETLNAMIKPYRLECAPPAGGLGSFFVCGVTLSGSDSVSISIPFDDYMESLPLQERQQITQEFNRYRVFFIETMMNLSPRLSPDCGLGFFLSVPVEVDYKADDEGVGRPNQ